MSDVMALGGTYSYLQHYIDLASQMDREAFRRRVGSPVLIAEAQKKRISFAIGDTKQTRVQEGKYLPSQVIAQSEKLPVYEIKRKVEGSVNRVVIGRAVDCDVVIGDETVSMLQSVFVIDPHTWRCTIEDMDSKNGTLLNGESIAFGEPTELSDGDTLAMGDLKFLFYYPEGLYDILKASVDT